MRVFQTVAWLLCCFFLLTGKAALAAPVAASAVAADGAVQWQPLEKGLDLARVAVSFTLPGGLDTNPPGSPSAATSPKPTPEPMTVTTTVLRIDPAEYAFSLYMASESGPKSLAAIGESEKFVAAINAGMFQRDGLTNTGYLRSPTHTNNKHVAANFGAFFVAEPENGKPPLARLLDRQADDWESALTRYGIVLQNYRMATTAGRVIWKQAERFHSVAALSQDAGGRIFFLLCPSPVPAAEFMEALLRLPLGLGAVMYLEGGSEAALYLNAGGVTTVEAGRHISGFWGGGGNLMLPNVLGIRKRPALPAVSDNRGQHSR